MRNEYYTTRIGARTYISVETLVRLVLPQYLILKFNSLQCKEIFKTHYGTRVVVASAQLTEMPEFA